MPKALFAGASSFTGFYFAKALYEAGYEVHALFQKKREAYEGLRKRRVEALLPFIHPHFETSLQAIDSPLFAKSFDLFSFHAGSTHHYKSLAFDPLRETLSSFDKIDQLLETLKKHGLKKVYYTQSLFARSGSSPPLSPYGISKTIGEELLHFWCRHFNIAFSTFTIPHTFGPFDEERLPHHLISCWKRGETVHLEEPETLCDFIPVTLLAKAYASQKMQRPLFRPESALQFSLRFGNEMGKRLSLMPKICSAQKTKKTALCLGDEPLLPEQFSFSEEPFWDELASFYR